MNSKWLASPLLALLALALSPACDPAAPAPDDASIDGDLAIQAAFDRIAAGDPELGLSMLHSLRWEGDEDLRWQAFSAEVATLRAQEDWDGALDATADMAETDPDRAGLMALWDGDTWMMAGETELALASYAAATRSPADMLIGERHLAAVALDQMSGALQQVGLPLEAAEVKRDLLGDHPQDQDPRWLLAEILMLEAEASGQLPDGVALSPDQDGTCAAERPCVVGDGDAPVDLIDVDTFEFRPSDADLSLLDAAEHAAVAYAAPPPAACTTPTATNGFQDPMTTSSYGYEFMDYPDSTGGYHPGTDSNGPGGCDDDYGTTIASLAKGCVTDAGTSTWGSATIQSDWNSSTWTHQYGHMYYLYYSSGASISKGATLGKMGNVGATCAHLHWEIREDDHPDPTNADYYSTSSQTNVGDWYQEPETFVDSRIAYTSVDFFDEDAFSRTGTWTYVSTVGSKDDMRYAATTATGSKTNYARYSFTPAGTGTWQLWAFVPWNYATSTKAPVKLVRSSDSATMISGTINQNSYYDAWIKVGSSSLSTTKSYYVEVASNTGETSKKVGLDGFLLILP